jgi:hypothetical protein
LLGNAGEHPRADLLAVMKREHHVRPAGAGEYLVGALLTLERPPEAVQGGKYPSGLRRRPVTHRPLRGAKVEREQVWCGLAVLKAVGKHTQRQGLRASRGLLLRGAVCQDPGQIRHLGDVPAVLFAIEFQCQVHRSSAEQVDLQDTPIAESGLTPKFSCGAFSPGEKMLAPRHPRQPPNQSAAAGAVCCNATLGGGSLSTRRTVRSTRREWAGAPAGEIPNESIVISC